MSTTDQSPAETFTEAQLDSHAGINPVTGDAQENHGYTSDKDAYLRRLKRIEGQVRGIARMIDEDKYCIDILTQVSAINKALHAVSIGLLEEHIAHCVVGAATESQTTGEFENIDAKVKEASDAISRLLRS
ncbi:metal-sensitive transcriptional regulator [Arthrobacter sp. H14]|uniref:metal-sensitive transcriptional regulator n=1 Tax=Arthrobacter sp. H14 TaxID=1312959 RepID=UPI0004B02E6A|nr:metal-sensitive transcriptional regulator [Arthrobacter sp. H14]